MFITVRAIIVVVATAAIGGATLVHAQDAAQPAVNVPSEGLEQTPASTAPSPTPVLPELSALDQAFNQTGLGKDADEMRLRVEMRKLQNEVARDPAVVAAKTAAGAAPTDLEKRELLREYYEINYGLMSKRASNPALKAAIDQSKREHVALLSQPRVRPGSGESPAPTPKKKKKHRGGKHF